MRELGSRPTSASSDRTVSSASHGARTGGWGRPLLFGALALWTFIPLVLLLVVSVSGGWRFPTLLGVAPGLDSWRSLSGRGLGRAVLTSVGLATSTGLIAAAFGLPLGRALARLGGWARSIGAGCAFLPVATPPLVVGVGLQYTFLRLGLGGTGSGVLLAHLIPATGYTALFFLGVFSSFDFEIEEEARRLGATPLQTLAHVTFPLMRRPVAEAFVLGFLVSWAQVPLTLLIGQGRIRTLAIEVLAWVQAGQDVLAAAGAILLAVPPLLLIAVAAWAVRDAEVVVA